MAEEYVVAVAGGGKTTYLVKRIKEALADTSPNKIIAVTYTRNMAKELKTKIGEPLKYCGTLHHILYTLLNEAFPEKYLSIIAEQENADICADIGIRLRIKATPALLNRVLLAKDYELSYNEQLFKKQYLKYFESIRSISYPLIEVYGAELANRGDWHYLFVDEYQDMSLENMQIMRALKSEHKLFVFDPMQSIYGFRGARPDLLPQGQEILGHSYRCPSAICDLANHLLNYSKDLYPVRMEPSCEGGDLKIVREEERYAELRNVVDELLLKYKPGEIAILGRTNKILEEAQTRLEGLPLQKVSSHILNSQEMLAFKYMLRILSIPDNYNVIRFAKAAHLITKEEAALSDYIDPITGKPTTLGNTAADSVRDSGMYKNLLEAVKRHPLEKAARIMMETFSTKEWIIDECVAVIQWLELMYGDDYAAIENALSEMDTDALIKADDRIKIMTVHTAKGLEYKAIVIVNVYNGVFPHFNADVAEELRLFYVAITRARETCVILQSGKHTWLDNYSQPLIALEDTDARHE